MRKYPLFIWAFVLLLACSKEKIDCPSDFDENVEILESSIQNLSFYQNFDMLSYTNLQYEILEINTIKSIDSIWVLFQWECPDYEIQQGTFWDINKYIFLEVEVIDQLDTTKIEFIAGASFNSSDLSLFSDVLTLQLYYDDKKIDTGFRYVIDSRMDDKQTNDHLYYSMLKNINGVDFYEVYSFENENFYIDFNEQFGLLKIYDKIKDSSLLLN